MSFSSLLTQKCDIYRKTTTKNQYEHTVNVWNPIALNVKCRIDYMFVTSSYLSQTPQGHIRGNDYIGFYEYGTDILEGDRIHWQSLKLYARPVNYVFASGNAIHHLEVMFGLQEI